MAEDKKGKTPDISDLPAGLRELVDIPASAGANIASAPKNAPAVPSSATPTVLLAAKSETILIPAHTNAQQPAQTRPKTQKEQELDALIAKRQEIIGQLKAKNPLVIEARKKITALIPGIRGTGASHTMKLAQEEERIEFSIATEADTPKKEKEMLKRLRQIKQELGKHKEIDDARKAIDAQRSALHSIMGDIKSLERELADVRGKCDLAYAAVLAERKAAYESRQKGREERQHRREEGEHRRFQDLQKRVYTEKKREYDSEMQKYMKKHDDTVSMEEIVQFTRKEKKAEKIEESQ